MVPNPEYEKAHYELCFIDKDGNHLKPAEPPRRAATMPPDFQTFEQLMGWFHKNEVPSHILVGD